MKVSFVLVCTCAILSIKKARGSAIGAPFHPLNPEDLSDSDIKEIEYWDKYFNRQKRTLETTDHISGSAALLNQLKSAVISGTHNKISHIVSTSAGASSKASSGTFDALVDIGRGAAGASSGAFNGLVHIGKGAASASSEVFEVLVDTGKGAANVISGSAGAVNHLKTALLSEVTKKVTHVSSSGGKAASKRSISAVSGSSHAAHQLKTAALTGIVTAVGQIGGGSAKASAGASSGLGQAGVGAISGSANAIHQLKNAALAGIATKVGQIASGSAKASAGASSGLGQAGVGAISGSANAIHQLKNAALTGIATKVGQLASGSAKASVGVSSGLGQAGAGALSGSANAVHQLKSAVLSGLVAKAGQLSGSSATIASKASSGLIQASAGTVTGSSQAVKQLKAAAVAGITSKIGQIVSGSAGASANLASAGSAGLHQGANALTGSAQGSAKFIHQLKTTLINELLKHITMISTGSATAVAGASSGLKTKVAQVSTNLVTGSADAVGQLKHAIVAGTKKKLGQAASGIAGAITGAVGSASAGSGQLARGTLLESSRLIHQLKTTAVESTKSKINQLANGSAEHLSSASSGAKNALTGSASGIHQVKSAALAGITKNIGDLASSSAGAVAGASGHIVRASGGTVTGSAKAIHQIKSATIEGTKQKIATIARGSAGASGSFSSGLSKRSIPDQPTDSPKRSEPAWSTGSGSGSADIVNQLKSAVVAGLTKKIGQVARGSAGALAGASGGFSKGSSGGDSKGYHYEPGPSYEHKQIDVWDLKKSVFNTLLQAVKAIKGGVLAIKGQLIKGSGYIVSGGGKLIAASGDKVTSLGKNIISNAVLVRPNQEPHHPHSEYGHSGSYTAPSGPPITYDAPPSGISHESHYENSYDHPGGPHAGILILRRMPTTKDKYRTSHSNHEEYRVPPFKPLSPTGPSFGTVVGKFFTASTSLDSAQPTPFGNSAHGDVHYTAEDSHSDLSPPAPPYFEEPRHNFDAAPPSFQAPLVKEHQLSPTPSNGDFSTSINNFGGDLQPPGSSAFTYGGSFEEPHNFLNINDHLGAESSNAKEHKVKLTKGEIVDHLDSSPTLATSQVLLSNDADQSLQTSFSGSYSRIKKTPPSSKSSFSQNLVAGDSSFENFLPKQTSSDSREVVSGSSAENYQKYLEHFRFHKAPSSSSQYKSSSSKTTPNLRLKVQQDHRHRPTFPNKGGYDVVRSVSYEITPDGAKRLS